MPASLHAQSGDRGVEEQRESGHVDIRVKLAFPLCACQSRLNCTCTSTERFTEGFFH